MHFSTISSITVFLAASAFANPIILKGRNETAKAVVQQTIDNWLNDIKAVNTFVDNTKATDGDTAISAAASTAFKAAQDEGASNTALQQAVKLVNAGNAASQALTSQFDIIGPAINDTIFNPGNLQKNLDAINGARCPPPVGAGAISLEGTVQAGAASAVGIKVDAPATPSACSPAAKRTN